MADKKADKKSNNDLYVFIFLMFVLLMFCWGAGAIFTNIQIDICLNHDKTSTYDECYNTVNAE